LIKINTRVRQIALGARALLLPDGSKPCKGIGPKRASLTKIKEPNALRETASRSMQFFTPPGLRKLMNILERVLDLLKTHDKMTVATLRADGFPQATTVNYVNEGLVIYFGCSARSQKAGNIERDDRVSLAIDHEYADWSKIQGLYDGRHR
jgi:pyridoxine/pyridoxamine 5'-phosphate oxidase